MTAERLAGKQGSRDGAGGGAAPLPTSAILALSDRLLAEIGRRSHLFAWLRPPGAVEEWLTVDAYYPSNRLVVICSAQPAEHEPLYDELIPAHGLRLLRVAPGELGSELAAAELALQRKLADLGPAPRRPTGPPVDQHRSRAPAPRDARPPAAPSPQPRVSRSQAAAAERAVRFVAAHRGDAAHAPDPASRPVLRQVPRHDWSWIRPRQRAPLAAHTNAAARRHQASDAPPVGLGLGAALAVIVGAELYLAVVGVAISGGNVLLGVALVLDACARTVGTIVTARASESDWAWGCAIFGSPVVAAFALSRRP